MGCKFKIGQKIVAIRDHSEKDFLKDQEFTVLDIDNVCGAWVVKIFDENFPCVVFCRHNSPWMLSGRHYSEKNFEPVQEVEVSSMSFDDAIKLTEPKKELITD
jgi:hypothetical protein